MRPQPLDPRPYFANWPDPRRETRNKPHKLQDILMIVLCAVLSGVEDWVGSADFADEKEVWLRNFLELPTGIPSHDTLSLLYVGSDNSSRNPASGISTQSGRLSSS